MNEFIQSRNNENVKEARSLSMKKHRDSKGFFIVEGLKIIEDAVSSGVVIRKLFISEKLYKQRKAAEDYADEPDTIDYVIAVTDYTEPAAEDVFSKYKNIKEIFIVSDTVFESISDTAAPQGILAVAEKITAQFECVIEDESAEFLVLLENVCDPGNLGTIIRTADAAGADMVIMANNCTDRYNPKVVRSAAGSLFHLPVCEVDNSVECVKKLKREGFTSYAGSLRGRVSCFEANMEGKACLVLGNEANGISRNLAGAIDVSVKIPIKGKAESLNVSVAAGILMYEKMRAGLNTCSPKI